MADEAGARPGDVIAQVAGCPVRSLADLAEALRRAGRENSTEIAITRDGSTGSRTVTVQRAPTESIEGQSVSYGALEVPGACLRTIVTHRSDDTPRPAVLVLQGIGCESIDFGTDPDAPLARLVRGWAQAGFVTMRADRRGLGDSTGGPCAESDFETDHADHRASLEALRSDPRVDPDRIFLFGHSVGGMVAAVLAAAHEVAGVVVYGTSPAKWLDCVAASVRRQLALRGVNEDEIERRVAAFRARLSTSPPNGRTAAYHRQLHAVDLEAAWRRVDAPVLVLRGEHDWVVGADEQARIATLAPSARIVDLPRLDHMMTAHPSVEDSIRDYGHGATDLRIVAETVAWLEAHSVRSPP